MKTREMFSFQFLINSSVLYQQLYRQKTINILRFLIRL